MSEITSNMPNRDDLDDRLIDVALGELLGGQAPPDLSGQILARAGVQSADHLATVGGEVMNEQAPRRAKSGLGWSALAVAAALLVAVGWLNWPPAQAVREAARRSPEPTKVGQTPPPTPWSDDDAKKLNELPMSVRDEVFDTEGKGEGGAGKLQLLVTPEIRAEEKEAPASGDAGLIAQGGAPAMAYLEAFNPQVIDSRGVAIAPSAPPAPEEAGASYYGLASSRGGEATPAAITPVPADGAAPAQWDRYSREQLGKELATVEAQIAQRQSSSQSKNSTELHRLARLSAGLERRLDVLEDLEQGQGPGLGGDKYARIVENPFKAITAANTENRLSTFSIDVDTASYANVRQFLMQSGTLPPPDAVRIEELMNYFDYDYTAPTDDTPFAANVEVASCPWNADHRLVRVGIKGREIDRGKRPQSNLVFLIDVSGSMNEPNKLPLLVEGMKMLTRELGENDRVAIVVYASSEGLALESTSGTEQDTILAALDQLSAGGSTAGGAGIQLAYQKATDNFIKGAVNRVILCTDGDFNVGVTSPAELERMAETKAKETGVFLTVLGFGRGNLNDAMMEQIADKGNGNYHYVDGRSEARKVLVEEMAGTLVTIVKDVKIQIEFNPTQVAGYRLIGYENRVLAAEDFNDDKKDAGEIGAGHTVTALYEIVPPGKPVEATEVDELKYQPNSGEIASAIEGVAREDASDELLTLKIRYKAPDGDKSTKLEFPITDNGQKFAAATEDFKFASAVASFGMLLRGSEFKGNATYAAVLEIAESASRDRDGHGYRKEFVEMVRRAKELSGE